ncbi:hypothetical protein P5V15_009476 [Pogonomyrmex californicus]
MGDSLSKETSSDNSTTDGSTTDEFMTTDCTSDKLYVSDCATSESESEFIIKQLRMLNASLSSKSMQNTEPTPKKSEPKKPKVKRSIDKFLSESSDDENTMNIADINDRFQYFIHCPNCSHKFLYVLAYIEHMKIFHNFQFKKTS